MRYAILLLSVLANAASVEQLVPNLKMNEPFGVAFDRKGNWYIVEHKGERIMRVDPGGAVSLYAGTGEAGYSGDGGPAVKAQFKDPHGIVIAPNGDMYVADTLNHCVRKIDGKSGVITTFAGTGEPGFGGDGGPAQAAKFNGTFAIALNPAGSLLYVADLNNRRVRAITLKTGRIDTVAGNGERGVPQDGSAARSSPLEDPRAVAADAKGNVYILERRGNALRVVGRDGKIRTLVAPGAVKPDMNGPKFLCLDNNGDVLIADAENHLLRRYVMKTGKLETIGGTGKPGRAIDPADLSKTELTRPHGVYVHKNGDIYVVDSYNHRILRVKR